MKQIIFRIEIYLLEDAHDGQSVLGGGGGGYSEQCKE
jgi:hypothetical protein